MNFTLIVLSYNHPEITARAVRSALNLQPPSVLLVHNGSILKHIEVLKNQFPKVDHLILESNQGYSGGVNAGLEKAFERSQWALFMSNDCEIESLPVFPDTPCVLIPLIFKRKTDRVDSIGGGFDPVQAYIYHHREKARGEIDYVPGSAFAVHRDVFRKVGGMDVSLGTYWDDVDWSMRVRSTGFKLSPQIEWRMRHHVGKTCHQNPLYSIYYFQRNRKRISWKYASRGQRPILALRLATAWLVLGIKLVRKGRWRDLSHLQRAVVD